MHIVRRGEQVEPNGTSSKCVASGKLVQFLAVSCMVPTQHHTTFHGVLWNVLCFDVLLKWVDCVEEEREDDKEEKKQKVEDACEEREAGEQRRGVEQAESGGEKEQETEEEGEERERE